MSERVLSRKAVAALVLAVLSFGVFPFADLPGLTIGAAALLLAVLGLRDIRRSWGALKGRGLAVAGLVTEGGALLVFLLVLPAVQRVREASQRMIST
jgi:hypothetical protein